MIESGTPLRPSSVGVLAAIMLLACIVAAGRRQWVVVVYTAGMLGMLVFLAAGVPQVRERLPVLRRDWDAPVAGVGFVEDRRGRRSRWTVGEAIMFVAGSGPSSPVHVRLVGAAGWCAWVFASPKYPEFVRLWQRWAHPRPRPELVE